MPEVTCTTTMALSREAIWEFVKDMNNWAPFLTGYQKHEIVNETDSIWTLRGDVGILSRTVRFQAHVTEWNGPERVTFSLKGLNEEMDGGGCLEMAPGEAAAAKSPAPTRPGFLQRLLTALARFFFRRKFGTGPERLSGKTGGPVSKLTFTLRMDAGGPTGPLVNAMLAPALQPAAEDLANKIAAHLEQKHAKVA